MPDRGHRHIWLKILALILGFTMWYVVGRESGSEFVFSVPIELQNVPEGLEVIQETAQQAEIRLRGSADVLRRLNVQEIRVGVDLSDASPGNVGVYLTAEDVSVPFGVRVIRVTPTSLKLELDQTMGRTVEVVPRVIGSPAQGFELANIALTPESIRLVGPSVILNGIDQITTEPVSSEGLRERYSRTVQLELTPLVRLENPTNVELTLDIQEERIRREFRNVLVKAFPEGTAARLRPKAVSVTVEGPRSVVDRTSTEDLEARVELQNLSPEEHRVNPRVLVRVGPELTGLQIIEVKPSEIVVVMQDSDGLEAP